MHITEYRRLAQHWLGFGISEPEERTLITWIAELTDQQVADIEEAVTPLIMPDIIGQFYWGEPESQLAALGLDVHVGYVPPPGTGPADTVVSTSPVAGEVVVPGQFAFVNLNPGVT